MYLNSMQREWTRAVAKTVRSESSRRWIRAQQLLLNRLSLARWWGPFRSFRRLKPIRPTFGWGHGQCIDRYYIEDFLGRYADDIQGRVLEVANNAYTRRFGRERVIQSDVLNATPGNPEATIIADLACADDTIPSHTFDCIILTQTLELIYEVRTALRTLHRILKPGGVLLATFPGIRHISRHDMELWGEHWRFTTLSAATLFAEAFDKESVKVQTYGNVLTAVAFLQGLVSEELRREELDYCDQDYEVLIGVRAVKIG